MTGPKMSGEVYQAMLAETAAVGSRARGLDEQRRLLYGALAAGRTKRWELVGTLVNALTHHSGLEVDPYDLLDYLVEAVESPLDGPLHERGQRIRDLIAELSGAEVGVVDGGHGHADAEADQADSDA
jgi:hypothetical protein